MEHLESLVHRGVGQLALEALLGPAVVEVEVAVVREAQLRGAGGHRGARHRVDGAERERRGLALRIDGRGRELALGVLRHGIEVGIDRHQHRGRRQAVVPAVAHHAGHAFPDGGLQRLEPRREVPAHQVQHHAVVHQRVVVAAPDVAALVLLAAREQVGPHGVEQLVGHLLLLHELVARREVDGAEVVAPARGLLRLLVAPGLAQVGQRGRHHDALARQQVGGLRALAPAVERRVAAAEPALQVGVGALQQVLRHRQLVVARFHQQMHRIERRERIGTCPGPQRETAVGRLPRAQLHEVALERLARLGQRALVGRAAARHFLQQLGPARQQHGREGLARDLLGAAMRIGLEVLHETGGEGPGRGRHREVAAAEVRIEVALARDLARALEAAGLHQRDEGRGGPHAHLGGEPRAEVLVRGGEHQRRRTQHSLLARLGAHVELRAGLAALVDLERLRRIADHLEPARGGERERDGRFLARARDVVGQADADLDRVAGRHGKRRVRQDHHVAAHRGAGALRGGGLVVHGHRHHAQAAVEALGHGVAELAAAVHVDQARPVGHRLVALALERVQVLAELAFAVAAGRGALHQLLELGQDQVERLQRADLERALLEEVLERVGRLVARHLQDALVDREHHGARGLVAGELHLHRLAGLHELGARELQVGGSLRQAGGEGRDAVGERAHVDLVRGRVAHEVHVDVAGALEVLGQHDLLHRGGLVGLEPGMRIDLVALDGDEARADVGCADADLDLLPGFVVLAVERELQLGIAVERTADVGIARHAVLDAVELEPAGIAHHVGEVARRAGVERHVVAGRGDGQRLLVEHDLLAARFVAVQAVVLLDQHRQHLALHALQHQIGHRGLLRLRVDRDHVRVARSALAHVAGVTVDLDAHQVGQVAHQRARLGRHAAPALGLEGLGQHVHLVGCGFEARQPQVELGLALGAGLHAAEVVHLLLGRALRIEEGVVGEGAEHREGRAQRERALDLAVGRGRAEEVLHVDQRLHVLGLHPAFGDLAAEFGRDLGAVGQELLHLHRGAAQQQPLHLGRAGRGLARQVEVDGVVAGGRGVLRGMRDLGRAAGAEAQLLAPHAQAARIDDLGFERQVAQ